MMLAAMEGTDCLLLGTPSHKLNFTAEHCLPAHVITTLLRSTPRSFALASNYNFYLILYIPQFFGVALMFFGAFILMPHLESRVSVPVPVTFQLHPTHARHITLKKHTIIVYVL